jgi:hypothetical protein
VSRVSPVRYHALTVAKPPERDRARPDLNLPSLVRLRPFYRRIFGVAGGPASPQRVQVSVIGWVSAASPSAGRPSSDSIVRNTR